MLPRVDPSPAVLRLADAQAGVLSHGQLAQIGLPPGAGQRWKKGWLNMGPELYCIREPTWESWCWAGVLHAGQTGVVGGLAAAHLQGLIPDPPDDINVWHERSSALRRIGDLARTVNFRRSSRRGMGALPRTMAEDTVMDAAREADEDETVALVARALAQRLTTPPRLLTQMEQRQRVAHRGVLTELCGEAATGVESVLEWRFLKVVVRAHGLPEPVRQPSLVDGTRSDCWWHDHGLVVELDGRRWHQDAVRDMDKDNLLALTGAMNLHYGWFHVTYRPCETARQLHQGLTGRGFDGILRRCPRCRIHAPHLARAACRAGSRPSTVIP